MRQGLGRWAQNDAVRFSALAKRTNAAGRETLKELRADMMNRDILHCPGSGFRLVRAADQAPLKLRGAHAVLGQYFWSAARFGGKTKRRGRGNGVTRLSNGRVYYGSAGGLARGKDVHQQVGDFVMMDAARYNAIHGPVDQLTRAVLVRLGKEGFLGVYAEYLVAHADLALGTAVDLVCMDRAGHLVFVELKTGYQDAFTAGKKGAKMRGPFSRFDDTPLNRARSQVLYAQALYLSHGPKRSPPKGCVVHVGRDGKVALFDMGPFKRTSRQDLARSMLAHIQRTPRKRPCPASNTNTPKKRRGGRPTP